MKSFRIAKDTQVSLIALGILLLACFSIQKRYDKIMHPIAGLQTKVEKQVLPSRILKYATLGFNNVIADYYWINIIQDFSGWDRSDPHATFLIDEYKNLVTADPTFAYPYLFGILTVPSKIDPASINFIVPIAQTGMRSLPYNWEIPFYLGTQYQAMKQPSQALIYIERAASLPLVPEIVTNVYNSFKRRGITGDSATRSFVQAIYETTESKTTKKIIKDNILLTDITYILKRVVGDYHIRYEKYPTSLDDLVEAKMIRIDDALKERLIVTISQKNGAVEVQLREGE